jgi:hypothetical protein
MCGRKDFLMKERLVMALLVLALAVPLVAQSQKEDAGKVVDETISVGQKTQKKQDEWADEKSDLMVRYRNASANIKYLEQRVDIETEKADALDERIAELERRLEESTKLKNSIQDTLDAVQGRLDQWLDSDLPFLLRERRARLAALDSELSRPDVTSADKLRRLLEVLQIEASYGTSVEVVQDRIVLESDTVFVDMLKLGRLALFWRTPDGERAGEYDIGTRSWVELDGSYHGDIQEAMDMAARIKPIEITELPLGRISR